MKLAGNDTGFYHPSDGELDITCNGNRCTRFLNSDITFYGPSGFRFEFLNNSGVGDIFRVQQGGGGQYFNVNTTMAYGIVSDQRIKTTISDMDDKKAVQMIKKLAPKKYKIKGNEKDECIGFLAQDVMKACGDEFKSIISDRGYKEDEETSPLAWYQSFRTISSYNFSS